jgi:hypothetical protein
LREQQINAEWRTLVVQVALQLGDLLAEHVWRVPNAANDTQAACVCNGGSELGSGGHVHAGQHDGVLDLQQVGQLRADLLWDVSVSGAREEERQPRNARGDAMLSDVT